MPQHVLLTATIIVRQSRISVEVTGVEERNCPLPTSHRNIPGCDPGVLAAIACRRDGTYKNVVFRPGVGTADYTTNIGSVLWARWQRMADFFRSNYGEPGRSSIAFIGPTRTGGAGDTQWRTDTASGVPPTADLVGHACIEFVELGVAEPMFDPQGRVTGLKGYGAPRFLDGLGCHQSKMDEALAEEWEAYNPKLRRTFSYDVKPIELPVCDKLVGCDLPLIVTGNKNRRGVGALEFVLTVERQFFDHQVSIVDLESIRDGNGKITSFLNRQIAVLCSPVGERAAQAFVLGPYGGISEHGWQGLKLARNKDEMLNTKSKAACLAARILPR